MANQDKKTSARDNQAEAAVNIARAKLRALYKNEPNATEELKEVETEPERSKHQEYMHRLSKSGRSLAEIQTAWHTYYTGLSDADKHEVWQEFYEEHERIKKRGDKPLEESNNNAPAEKSSRKPTKPESLADAKNRIVKTVTNDGRISKKQHLQSMIFGLGIGAVVVIIFLFGFFNERFIAPFITPSRSVSTTPIIIDPHSTVAGPENKVIIPKINVEIPVIYDSQPVLAAKTSKELEAGIQKTLEDGVVHYPRTPNPGELGNVPIVGHSSNNIFNQGKYKFAFVLLSKLEKGDTFYLTYDRVRYTYKIYDKKVVGPDEVGVLQAQSKASTATLITCDPPGTSINRLVVIGEQINPNPAKNKQQAVDSSGQTSTETLPGNAPSLWSRITGWIF